MPEFRLDEVVAARDAARGFSSMMERLRMGTAQRYVVFFRNRPQAVVLHVDEYERLLELAGVDQRKAA
jgi:PHD/YefM family antitoxin component YafN of YafNO toxin-antitoxin module